MKFPVLWLSFRVVPFVSYVRRATFAFKQAFAHMHMWLNKITYLLTKYLIVGTTRVSICVVILRLGLGLLVLSAYGVEFGGHLQYCMYSWSQAILKLIKSVR